MNRLVFTFMSWLVPRFLAIEGMRTILTGAGDQRTCGFLSLRMTRIMREIGLHPKSETQEIQVNLCVLLEICPNACSRDFSKSLFTHLFAQLSTGCNTTLPIFLR